MGLWHVLQYNFIRLFHDNIPCISRISEAKNSKQVNQHSLIRHFQRCPKCVQELGHDVDYDVFLLVCNELPIDCKPLEQRLFSEQDSFAILSFELESAVLSIHDTPNHKESGSC